jgi:hypothetical protein
MYCIYILYIKLYRCVPLLRVSSAAPAIRVRTIVGTENNGKPT